MQRNPDHTQKGRNTQARKQAKDTKAVTLVEKEDGVKKKGNHPPRSYGGSWKPAEH
jgi:hypothetical protein